MASPAVLALHSLHSLHCADSAAAAMAANVATQHIRNKLNAPRAGLIVKHILNWRFVLWQRAA